jgi:MraZ protein
MHDFEGEYSISVDNKGRFSLPALLRKQFPPGMSMEFVVKKGIDNCLDIIPRAAWNARKEKLKSLNSNLAEVRKLKQLMNFGFTSVELDDQNRIVLSKETLALAGISSDAVLSAHDDVIELWDAKAHHEHMTRIMEEYSRLSDKFLGDANNEPTL